LLILFLGNRATAKQTSCS